MQFALTQIFVGHYLKLIKQSFLQFFLHHLSRRKSAPSQSDLMGIFEPQDWSYELLSFRHFRVRLLNSQGTPIWVFSWFDLFGFDHYENDEKHFIQ